MKTDAGKPRTGIGVWLALMLALAAGLRYMTHMPGSPHASPLPALSGAVAELRDSLGRHVAVLAGDIGERSLWRHEALEASAGYIGQAFRAAGFELTSQHYTAQGKTVRNRHSCRVCIDCGGGGGGGHR